jgi:DNA-binding NarL/FixJ family response regulator
VRERQILSMLASGSTDADIAERLELSPATVQTHVRNAKAKLGARTRAQAVAMALRGGLIAS